MKLIDGNECQVAEKYGGGIITLEGRGEALWMNDDNKARHGDGKPTHFVITRRYDAHEEVRSRLSGRLAAHQ